MAAQTPPVNLDTIVTRMKFDTKAESPKLVFEAARWLTDDEYTSAQEQAKSSDAAKAVSATPAALDGVPAAPLALEGKRPAAAAVAVLPEQEEEEAPAPAPKAKKAKAAPVVDEDDEPEVRKPEAKETAVPAKKSKLADIVADWDDE
jgi:hypothetical protein